MKGWRYWQKLRKRRDARHRIWEADTRGGIIFSSRLSRELRAIVQPFVAFRRFVDRAP